MNFFFVLLLLAVATTQISGSKDERKLRGGYVQCLQKKFVAIAQHLCVLKITIRSHSGRISSPPLDRRSKYYYYLPAKGKAANKGNRVSYYYSSYSGYYYKKPKRAGAKGRGKGKAKGTASSYYYYYPSYYYSSYYSSYSSYYYYNTPKRKGGKGGRNSYYYYYPSYYYYYYYNYNYYYYSYYYYSNPRQGGRRPFRQGAVSTAVGTVGVSMLIVSCLFGVVGTGVMFWCWKNRKFSNTRTTNRDQYSFRQSSSYGGKGRYRDVTTSDSGFTTDSSDI